MRSIRSRDNPLLVRLRRLQDTPGAYRKIGQVWLEGEHLCAAALARAVPVPLAVATPEALQAPSLASLLAAARERVIVPQALFAALSVLPSPAGIGFVLDLPPAPQVDPAAASVVLDGVQDAGNVGSILRSASAFGFAQVIALPGTAALWSPKVLRAGMGAHFALRLCETASADDLAVPLLATSSHATSSLAAQTDLPWPCAWVFGHEGQGVSPALSRRCAASLAIAQPGGEESLNVAAAAAICLYESASAAARR